jgi:hypothetical protein
MQNFGNVNESLFDIDAFLGADLIEFLYPVLFFQIFQRKVLHFPLCLIVYFVADDEYLGICFVIIFSLYDPVLLETLQLKEFEPISFRS